jgi:hypothetical protein
LLHRLIHVIGEHQPGGNHVYVTVRRGRNGVTILDWRALASRGLRLGLAQALKVAAAEATP